MIRIASVLLALTLPLAAQDPAADAEAMFYKAFYLEKGQRDFASAMALYDQFLAKAPDHRLAAEAAKLQFGLLDRTGKTKERDLFKAKYEKLLGNVVATGGGEREPGDAPREGGRGAGGAPGRGDQAARMAELEKALAKAKESGNEEEVKKLTQQIERLKQAGAGRGAGRGGMFGSKKLAEMTPDELSQFKDGLGRMEGMIERMRENVGEDQAKVLEEQVATLKKSLEGNKLEEAQKALDAIRAAMPRRRAEGGGPGGGAGGAPGGGGGDR